MSFRKLISSVGVNRAHSVVSERGPAGPVVRCRRSFTALFLALVEFDVICGADHADPLRPKSRDIAAAGSARTALWGLAEGRAGTAAARPHLTGWKPNCVKSVVFFLLPSADELL